MFQVWDHPWTCCTFLKCLFSDHAIFVCSLGLTGITFMNVVVVLSLQIWIFKVYAMVDCESGEASWINFGKKKEKYIAFLLKITSPLDWLKPFSATVMVHKCVARMLPTCGHWYMCCLMWWWPQLHARITKKSTPPLLFKNFMRPSGQEHICGHIITHTLNIQWAGAHTVQMLETPLFKTSIHCVELQSFHSVHHSVLHLW